jgi:hypothetical protein
MIVWNGLEWLAQCRVHGGVFWWPPGLVTHNPRKTVLTRASSIYKRQTLPLIREDAPRKQDRNSQIVINICSSRWDSTPRLTDWLTVSRNVTLTLTCRIRANWDQEYRRVQEVSLWRLHVWFEDFICAVVQWYLGCDSHSSCVKIRCQETDTENFAEE